MIQKIVSGGQTGVDRAALDVARELGLACGGWCPKGRKAEDGTLPAHYPLIETPSEDYAQRTTWNVRDAEGTLVLTQGEPTGGTLQTIEDAAHLGKPCLIVDLTKPQSVTSVCAWVTEHRIRVLNVAGPRESKSPGIYAQARRFLHPLFASSRASTRPARLRDDQ